MGSKDVFIEHRESFKRGRMTAVLDLLIHLGTGQPLILIFFSGDSEVLVICDCTIHFRVDVAIAPLCPGI
jgi:hypothetical protein